MHKRNGIDLCRIGHSMDQDGDVGVVCFLRDVSSVLIPRSEVGTNAPQLESADGILFIRAGRSGVSGIVVAFPNCVQSGILSDGHGLGGSAIGSGCPTCEGIRRKTSLRSRLVQRLVPSL